MAAGAAELSSSQPLIPPHATVVLLSGIPGDVESENSFHDQLQTWLDLVSSSQAAKLFVLSDSPETVNVDKTRWNIAQAPIGQAASSPLPSPPQEEKGKPGMQNTRQATVLKGDRTNFLAVAHQLSRETNNLVVIAWGHGGKQGNTPVFHVRGPRITPADFQALAPKATAVESRWILMFRSSGAFASRLAGEQRHIISSERDTSFTSDPIGMTILLKLVRANPSIGFGALSEQFGRATAAWYEERKLARTEDPTIWFGTDKPRLLAASSEVSTNEEQQAGGPAARTATNADSASASPEPGSASRILPAYWKELPRVEAKSYPDADGVVLRRRLSYTLGSNPAISSEQDEFIQILNPEGKRLGDFDISYTPPFEDVSFLDCEVLGPDGTLARLDPDAIREAREQSVGDYQLGSRKFFSLPGVGPGAVLHVHYRRQWKTFPLPHISLEVPIASEMPVVESTVQVSVPKDTPFHFALNQLQAADPAIQQGAYGTTYSWHFANLPAYEEEILSPPSREPRLLLSTFPDWQAFADWYTRISKLTDEVTPALASKAKELTRESKSDREKILAVYNYVSGLRYVAVPLGVNSVRPHTAASVLQNQYGDCKDKANLFNTLLHSLNLQSSLVLVPRFSQAYDAIPGLAFNHAISCVNLDGEKLWVDTTDEVCRFGLLPPGDPGRKVLIVADKTSGLTQLPLPAPDDHQLKIHGEVTCLSPEEGALVDPRLASNSSTNPQSGGQARPASGTPAVGGVSEDALGGIQTGSGGTGVFPVAHRPMQWGDALPTRITAIAQGYADYALRTAARQTKEHGTPLPLLAAKFRPVAGAFALEKQTATSASALDDNFSWQAEGASVGLVSPADGKWLLRSPFWLPKEWDLALHQRKSPLFLNEGYPLTLEEEFVFALPANTQPETLPALSENQQGPLRWTIEWKNDKGKLLARMRAVLVRGELSAAETPVVQQQLRALLTALAGSASLAMRP